MTPVFLLLGAFGLLAWLESRHSSMSGAGAITTGRITGGPGGGLGSAGADYATGEKFGLQAVSAIPLVGPILAQQAGKIIGMITQHHVQALAAEGKALNDATPRAMQTFALIVQAAAQGQITTFSQALQLVQNTVDLWYGEVRAIQRGVWHYRGYNSLASFLNSDFAVTYAHFPERVPPDPFDDQTPNPCNGACSLGHYFLERRAAIVLQAVNEILAGKHGRLVLSQVPPHATQQGFPPQSVTY